MSSTCIVFLLLGTKQVHEVTNHPVHLADEKGHFSPTALIPFCRFGGNMSIMSMNIPEITDPVCSSFRPKIQYDQLCYEVDPNKFKRFINEGDEISLELFINYNEDRKISTTVDIEQENFIVVQTIGIIFMSFKRFNN